MCFALIIQTVLLKWPLCYKNKKKRKRKKNCQHLWAYLVLLFVSIAQWQIIQLLILSLRALQQHACMSCAHGVQEISGSLAAIAVAAASVSSPARRTKTSTLLYTNGANRFSHLLQLGLCIPSEIIQPSHQPRALFTYPCHRKSQPSLLENVRSFWNGLSTVPCIPIIT